MSDWNAQHSGIASALAGLDMSMPGDIGFSGSGISHWGGNLTAAVLNGTVPEWRLDDMVVRIMSAWYKVGRDKTAVPVNFSSWTQNTTGYGHTFSQTGEMQVNFHINVQDDHAKLVREIGQRSTVLLKNTKNALPLKKPASIAVIGEDAHSNPDGVNSCSDRGCDKGTLAMGWGSGAANFPYLVAPVDALRDQATHDKTKFTNISNNYGLSAVAAAAAGADVAVVFVNADSGEAYINVDDNQGDRKNLTLWQGGDDLVKAVAAVNKNTIVVMHTVGPVIVEYMKQHENITGLIWAGLQGQESGNTITDVLYGKVNPSAKSVFTWGKDRADWGADVLYTSPLDNPQINFTEGVFIDYRHFDKAGIEPSYEFGYGLSYTSFSYSNLSVKKIESGPYEQTIGLTKPAPTFGTIDKDPDHAEFPAGFPAITPYVYPYITQYDPLIGGGLVPPGSQDSSPQHKVPAGGSAGGNRQLWDVLYEVTADIKNTCDEDGIEVVQLVWPLS
jgi:Glycosyl hydrolase family 3 C-terminal domain